MIFGLEPERVRRDSSSEHRHPSIASRRTRGAIVRFSGVRRALRTSVGDAVRSGEFEERRTAGDRRRSLSGSAPDRWPPRSGAVRDGSRSVGDRAIGKPPHRAVGGRSRRRQPGRERYTPGVPWHRGGPGAGFSLGGPAIARPGRVVRPVRRPSDRQNPRRHSGGDPREICNQVPSRLARAFSILDGAAHATADARSPFPNPARPG